MGRLRCGLRTARFRLFALVVSLAGVARDYVLNRQASIPLWLWFSFLLVVCVNHANNQRSFELESDKTRPCRYSCR